MWGKATYSAKCGHRNCLFFLSYCRAKQGTNWWLRSILFLCNRIHQMESQSYHTVYVVLHQPASSRVLLSLICPRYEVMCSARIKNIRSRLCQKWGCIFSARQKGKGKREKGKGKNSRSLPPPLSRFLFGRNTGGTHSTSLPSTVTTANVVE